MPEHTILTATDQTSPIPHRIERRATVRYPFNQPALWRASDSHGSVCLWGRVRDISLEGIGLVLKRGLKPRTILIVELEGPRGQATCSLEAQVVHATLQPDGTWHTGCSLARRLTEQELKALLSWAQFSD
jgi:hypothetical protein